MPRKTLRRGASALLATLVAVLVAVAMPATPAFADDHGCCQVSIDRLPGQFVVGGDPQSFTLHVTNASDSTLRVIDVSFTLTAGGLVGDLVDLERQMVPNGPHDVGTFTQRGVHDGAVIANDEINLGALAMPPGGGVDIQYQLAFNRRLPSSALTLSVQVQAKRGGGDRTVSSSGPYQSQLVAAGQAAPTPSVTPTAGDTPTGTDTDTAGPDTTAPVAGGIGSGGGGGSLVWLAYTVGGLLLLGGVGLTGTLLARRGSRRVPADPDLQHHLAPPSTALAAPTRQLPIGQDPWADPDQTWVDPPAKR